MSMRALTRAVTSARNDFRRSVRCATSNPRPNEWTTARDFCIPPAQPRFPLAEYGVWRTNSRWLAGDKG
jgi:hypothetical protein